MFATGETVSLAEWIIDDTCLLYFTLRSFTPMWVALNCHSFLAREALQQTNAHLFRRSFSILIHSANPKSQPVGIIVFAHVVRPSPLFKSSKTKQQKTMFATGVTMGLAGWIIDDTCLV